ncbi:MAG: hypothetical protein BGO11_09370 [Solirubrobacterales bacterium 70-9]|nr:MAG: hypothetical protein BGO11_09370 [Solirubrobacterales bacterium 70-9]
MTAIATAVAIPTPSVPGAAYSRRQAIAAATTIRPTMPSVAVVPCPGARERIPETVRIAANPTAGSSQHHSRRPASENVALPTSNEARQISAAEA